MPYTMISNDWQLYQKENHLLPEPQLIAGNWIHKNAILSIHILLDIPYYNFLVFCLIAPTIDSLLLQGSNLETYM